MLRKLQHESKSVSSELAQVSTAASQPTSGGTHMQQMQFKAQRLQQCIDDKLQEVTNSDICQC